MKSKLRWFGAAVLLLNLWLIGRYNLSGVPVLLMTFGFAIAYELVVVRAVGESTLRQSTGANTHSSTSDGRRHERTPRVLETASEGFGQASKIPESALDASRQSPLLEPSDSKSPVDTRQSGATSGLQFWIWIAVFGIAVRLFGLWTFLMLPAGWSVAHLLRGQSGFIRYTAAIVTAAAIYVGGYALRAPAGLLPDQVKAVASHPVIQTTPPQQETDAIQSASATIYADAGTAISGADLLNMAANKVSPRQFGDAARIWLNSHAQYDNPHDREALQEHLNNVLSQYPQIAVGPALDMALQRALRAGSEAQTRDQARAQAHVAARAEANQLATRARNMAATAAASGNAGMAAGLADDAPEAPGKVRLIDASPPVTGGTPNTLPSWDSVKSPPTDPAKVAPG